MSVLERRPSYRESNKGRKERQGPTLGVRLIEVSVKRESTVFYIADPDQYQDPAFPRYCLSKYS